MRSIKNTIILLLAAIMALITAGPAFAASGAPVAFDDYVVGDVGGATTGNVAGEITAGCTNAWAGSGATVTCGEATISDGMLQRQVTVSGTGSDDGTYIQFILVESGAQGDASAAAYSTARGNLYFTNEDFVKMNNRGDGLASKQTILDASFDAATNIEERFSNVVSYNIGWAHDQAFNDPWVTIDQKLEQLQYNDAKEVATSAYELMNETTHIISDGVSSGATFPNTLVQIDQSLLMQDEHTVNPMADGVQKFKHSRTSGAFTSLPTDGLANTNPLLEGGTNGGHIDWAIGDTLSANWIGYQIIDPSQMDIIFGVTSFENTATSLPSPTSLFTKRVRFDTAEAGGPAPMCPADNAVIYYLYNSGTGQCDTYLVSGDTYVGTTPPDQPGGWDGIIGADTNPLFGAVPSINDVNPVSQLTDYAVKDLIIVVPPSANLNYIAPSATLPTANPTAVDITDNQYNQWTVASGVFTMNPSQSCPTIADACEDPSVNADGLYQRRVIINGEAYYQTILVADGSVSGDPNNADFSAGSVGFVTETFVKAGAGSGLAGRFHLAERDGYDNSFHLYNDGANTYPGTYLGTNTATNDLPNNAGDLVQDAAFNMGWANMGSVYNATTGETEPHAAIALTQDSFIPDYGVPAAIPIKEHFSMETGANQADKRIMMTSQAGTTDGPTATDFTRPINFKSVTVAGAYQQTSYDGTNMTTASGTVFDPFGNGNTSGVTWDAGDALQISWLAGQYGVTASVGNAMLNATSFSNRSTGTHYDIADTDTSPVGQTAAFWFVDPFMDAPNNYPTFP